MPHVRDPKPTPWYRLKTANLKWSSFLLLVLSLPCCAGLGHQDGADMLRYVMVGCALLLSSVILAAAARVIDAIREHKQSEV